MLELIGKTVYILFLYASWHVLHKILFAKQGTAHPSSGILKAVVLACLHVMFNQFLWTFYLHPILMLLAYCLLSDSEAGTPWKPLLIESAFTYAATVVVSLFSVPFVTAFCQLLYIALGGSAAEPLQIPYAAVTSVKCLVLSLVCLILRRIYGSKDLSALSKNAPLPVFAVISILYLTGYIFIRIFAMRFPSESKTSFLFATIVLCISLALFLVSARREHEVLTDREKTRTETEQLGRRIVEISDELDYYRQENHKLNKRFPALEHRSNILAEKLKALSGQPDLSGYSKALAAHQSSLQTHQEEVDRDAARLHFEEDLDFHSELPLLDAELEYQSRRMFDCGIEFDCTISDQPDCGVLRLDERDLHQIVANLLSNAVHAVKKRTSGKKYIIFTMGVWDGAYQIKVTDSADYFPAKILQNLGKPGNTTDGNGIGYVSLFRLLLKCGASLLIEEYDPIKSSGLTKRIAVRFDGLCRVTVHSHRAPEQLRNGRGVSELLDGTEIRH